MYMHMYMHMHMYMYTCDLSDREIRFGLGSPCFYPSLSTVPEGCTEGWCCPPTHPTRLGQGTDPSREPASRHGTGKGEGGKGGGGTHACIVRVV